jgi:hypothetical protein
VEESKKKIAVGIWYFEETNQPHDHADEIWPHTVGVAKPRLNQNSIFKSTHSPSYLEHLCPDENYFLSTNIRLADQRKTRLSINVVSTPSTEKDLRYIYLSSQPQTYQVGRLIHNLMKCEMRDARCPALSVPNDTAMRLLWLKTSYNALVFVLTRPTSLPIDLWS